MCMRIYFDLFIEAFLSLFTLDFVSFSPPYSLQLIHTSKYTYYLLLLILY